VHIYVGAVGLGFRLSLSLKKRFTSKRGKKQTSSRGRVFELTLKAISPKEITSSETPRRGTQAICTNDPCRRVAVGRDLN